MTPSPDQPSRPLPAPTARVVRAEVTEAPISVTELADSVQDAAAGAVVTFEGVVRNHDADRGVSGIGYSCHPTAGQIVKEIARDVAERGQVRALGVVHRVGDLAVGEAALAVAVSSGPAALHSQRRRGVRRGCSTGRCRRRRSGASTRADAS